MIININFCTGLYQSVILVASAVLVLSIFSCSGESKVNAPDVSHIDVQLKVKRFDRDFFALDTNNLEKQLPELGKQYPDLLPLFTVNLIHDQSNPTEPLIQAANAFLQDADMRHLFDTVQQVYPDLGWLERDLTQVFRYYRYYFPEKPVPTVATVVSGFATDVFTYGDSLCGIGLDMFLGENFEGYNPEVYPAYVRRQFKADYIPVRLARTLAQNQATEPAGERLLDLMLYNGKVLYLAHLFLPATPDSMIMGYTREQMDGCFANEQAVWARMAEQNLLYESDFSKIRKLVTPSPNAPVIFQEAPGEIGNWIGWRIVEAYMRRHPNTTMSELLKQQDSQSFLEASRYKPERPR